MRTLSIEEVEAQFFTIVEDVCATHLPVTITRRGRPAATIIATEDLNVLTETLAWLADPDHAKELFEAQEAMSKGLTMSMEEVRAQLS